MNDPFYLQSAATEIDTPSPVRRRLVQTCAALPLAWCVGAFVPARAAAQRKKFKIFVVIHRAGSLADEGFMDYLKNAGLEVEFVVRNIDNDAKLVPAIVAEIKQQKPDLIYTQSTQVTVGIAGTYAETEPQNTHSCSLADRWQLMPAKRRVGCRFRICARLRRCQRRTPPG